MQRRVLLSLFAALSAVALAFIPVQADVAVETAYSDTYGTYLTDGNGMTLYRFTPDEPGKSNCSGACAAIWPPLLVPDGERLRVPEALAGDFGVILREDGTRQATYTGWPLYLWVADRRPGDITGHGVDDEWYVVNPMPTVKVASHPEHGRYLVDALGMTLYLYTRDEENASNCSGSCATSWPPLIVSPWGGPVASVELPEALGVIERPDGALQVTYQGNPLYLWVRDQAPGETTGQGVGNVWYVVSP